MSDEELGREFRDLGDALVDEAELTPDFDDVLVRVQAQADSDPQLDALLPSVQDLEDADFDVEARRDDRSWLRPYVAAYRTLVDHVLDEHHVQPGGWTPARRTRWVAAFTAVAAVLVAFVGLAAWPTTESGRRSPSSLARDVGEFLFSQDSAESDSEAEVIERPASAATPRPAAAKTPSVRSTPAPVPPPIPEVEPEPQPEPAPPLEPATKAPPSARMTLQERLAKLDARAQAAWSRGDRRAAERLYRKLIRLGGRRPAAELAYGELFSLVNQRGKAPVDEWTAYLAKFPRGRYAKDAWAGLCRRDKAPDPSRCGNASKR